MDTPTPAATPKGPAATHSEAVARLNLLRRDDWGSREDWRRRFDAIADAAGLSDEQRDIYRGHLLGEGVDALSVRLPGRMLEYPTEGDEKELKRARVKYWRVFNRRRQRVAFAIVQSEKLLSRYIGEPEHEFLRTVLHCFKNHTADTNRETPGEWVQDWFDEGLAHAKLVHAGDLRTGLTVRIREFSLSAPPIQAV